MDIDNEYSDEEYNNNDNSNEDNAMNASSSYATINKQQQHDNDMGNEEIEHDDGAEDAEGVVRHGPMMNTAQGARNLGTRRVRVPPHRFTPLRNEWENIMRPLVEYMKLQVRFNPRTRCVELRCSEFTDDQGGALQKGADFVAAFCLGFDVADAIALLRLDDLFIDSFEIKDVKVLHGDHLSRAIGRIAGSNGKTKYAIENATRTRIVIADQKIHIMGSFANIAIARDAISRLIIGAPPGKVYNRMKNVSSRMNEKF